MLFIPHLSFCMHIAQCLCNVAHAKIKGERERPIRKENITYLSIVVNRIGGWSIDLQLWLAILSDLTDKWYSLPKVLTFSPVHVIHFEKSNAFYGHKTKRENGKMHFFLLKISPPSDCSYRFFFSHSIGLPFPRFHTNCFLFLEI